MSSQHERTGDDNERAIPKIPHPRQPEDYEPLRGPGHTPEPLGGVSFQIKASNTALDETAPLNIHSHIDMLHAAVILDRRLRHLLAALDAERGETR